MIWKTRLKLIVLLLSIVIAAWVGFRLHQRETSLIADKGVALARLQIETEEMHLRIRENQRVLETPHLTGSTIGSLESVQKLKDDYIVLEARVSRAEDSIRGDRHRLWPPVSIISVSAFAAVWVIYAVLNWIICGFGPIEEYVWGD